jgi:arginine decarboxylase
VIFPQLDTAAPANEQLTDTVAVAQQPGLVIPVCAAIGTGATRLSSFDAALVGAGVANFNLVRLSSVIPTGAAVQVADGPERVPGGWGDLLYCVYAAETVDMPGEQAWAAVGWATTTDGSGRGVFVEHEAGSEAEVEMLVLLSLADLVAVRPEQFSKPQMVTSGITCIDDPVTALVVASYRSQAWGDLDGVSAPRAR